MFYRGFLPLGIFPYRVFLPLEIWIYRFLVSGYFPLLFYILLLGIMSFWCVFLHSGILPYRFSCAWVFGLSGFFASRYFSYRVFLPPLPCIYGGQKPRFRLYCQIEILHLGPIKNLNIPNLNNSHTQIAAFDQFVPIPFKIVVKQPDYYERTYFLSIATI